MRETIVLRDCLLCMKPITSIPTWKSLGNRVFVELVCRQCDEKFMKLNETVDGVYCLYEYNDAMKTYMQRLKFMKDVLLVHLFQREIYLYFMQKLKENKQLSVVPIPMHEENKRIRTFSHVDELLIAANIPFTQVLRKVTTDMQSKKTREERLKVEKLFDVICPVEGNNLIIFDDIKTTGVTLKLAKQQLLMAGAASVQLVALAGG